MGGSSKELQHLPCTQFPLPAGALLWHHARELEQPRLFLSFAEMAVKRREIDTELTHPCSAVNILVVLAPFLCVCVVGFRIFLLLFAFKKPQKVMRFKNLHGLSHFPCPILRHRPEKGFSRKKSSDTYFAMLAIINIWIHFWTDFWTVQILLPVPSSSDNSSSHLSNNSAPLVFSLLF